jgi:triosephosphate isomerase
MFKTKDEIQTFCQTFNSLLNSNTNSNIVVGIAPSYVGLNTFQTLNKTATRVMAQNVNPEVNGAFTSQISFNMLKDMNVDMVLIGHSEVRAYLHETDEFINKKVCKLLSENMTPVLCIGETLQQFEQGLTNDILAKQLQADLKNVNASQLSKLIIAYEPI